MPYNVLILDDDADFNSLLTDVFEQADYNVTPLTNPIEAVDVFKDNHFDLVVTDHRMPEMTGAEYMKVIKKLKPEVPVIMVSGYLENDTIRELIGDGVGGVFLKPLNIFSLLERTAELIEEAKKLENTPSSEIEDSSDVEVGAQLGFIFRSYPCKSGAAASFAERLYSLRNFKSTLSLIGERGMHYRKICEDIRRFYESDTEHFHYYSAGELNSAKVLSNIQKAKEEGAERVTCVFLELDRMDESEKAQATLLSKQEEDYKQLDIELRTVFCVSGDLDTLFDKGLIDENLYILMGTAEVRVPPLRVCNVDIGVMAQQIVVEYAREKSLDAVPRFERSARDLFRQHRWDRNYEELRETVRGIMDGHSGDVISYNAVKSALNTSEVASPRTVAESHLLSQQGDYLQAASILFDGDKNRTANFFGTDQATIQPKMK